jgi:hypothetical protein
MEWFGSLVGLVGYTVARASLPLLSFGRIQVEPFSAARQRLHRPFCRRGESGRIELRQAEAGWIGLGLCIIALLAVLCAIRAVSP